MAKKQYMKPVLMYSGLDDESDVVIVIGGSQGTSGYDSTFSYGSDLTDDIIAMIEAYCDDTDLAEMDTSDDGVISLAEYEAWYEVNGWW